jgi:RNA polymerase sigma-70 factor (ECF subfamily)
MAAQQIAIHGLAMAESDDAPAREDRFAALVHRQSRFIFGIGYALLRNTHDAEDVVQETFLKLYRSSAWETMHDERAFLARAAWRIAVDKLPRTRGTGPRPAVAPMQPTPEQAMIAADWNAVVHRLVDGLSEDLRQPLALSLQELTSRQIAEVLGIAEGTVRTRLMRARQLLKQKLAALREERHGK